MILKDFKAEFRYALTFTALYSLQNTLIIYYLILASQLWRKQDMKFFYLAYI